MHKNSRVKSDNDLISVSQERPSAALPMMTARSAIKILRRFIIFTPHHHFSF
jgi:hypothetical protein